MKNLLAISAVVCSLAFQTIASVINYDVSSKAKCDACGWTYNDKVGDQAAGLKFNKDGQITSQVSSYAISNVSFSYACSGTATTTRGFYFKPYDANGKLLSGYEGMLPFATMTTNYTFSVEQNVHKIVILMTGSGSTGTFIAKNVSFEFFQLEKPENLAESNVSHTGFDLSWSPVSGADTYDVEIKDGEDVVRQVNSIESTFCSAGDLDVGTEYSVFVIAVADEIYEPSEAAVLSVSTSELSVLDSPVLSVDTDDMTTSSATVSWASVEHASGYAVKVLFNDLAVFSDSLDAAAVSWTASNLQPGTEYEFSVTALGDGIDYADSAAAMVEFTTVENLSAPDWTVNPVSPEFEAGKAGSFTVSAVLGTDDLTSDVSLSVSPSPVSAPVLSNGSVSWAPAWEDAGKTYSFTFSVNVGGTDYEHLVLIPLDALPTVSLSVLPASVVINIGEPAETALSAVVSDSRDPLALTTVYCGKDDLTDFLDAETGAFSWTPSAVGEYVVSFSAADAYPLSAPVEFTVTVVAPPLEAVWPSVDEITSDSFLLEWGGHDQLRLDHFALRVWYGSCDMGSETTDKETFYEWYDNYMMKSSAYFPQGWTYSGTGRYSKANTPLQLASNGMHVITKKYPRPLTGFSFTLANNAARSTSTNNFEVYASKGGVEDDDWTLIPNDQCGPAGVKTFAFNAADGYRRVKVALKLPSCNIGIGSFSATYEGAGTHFVVGSKDEPVVLDKETASYTLENLEPGREYFVQLVTCGTEGEEKKLFAGTGTHEFYTRVMTAPAPASVITVY